MLGGIGKRRKMAFIKEKKLKVSSVIENLLPSGLVDGEPEKTEISPGCVNPT